MSKTIKQIADEIGVSKTAVRKQIENLGLRSSLRKNGNRFAIDENEETLILQAFLKKTQTKNANQTETKTKTANHEVSDLVSVLQSTIDTLQGQLAIKDKQIEDLHSEIEKEREHNREKDKQLLETLNKLAESQAALSAGQAADKQKALAEKIIEGSKQLSDEESGTVIPKSFFKKIFGRKKFE